MSHDGLSSRGRGRTGRGGRASSNSRETLLAAVALQDHIARTMRIPGGPKAQPSTQPGAEMTLAQHLGLIPRPPPLLSESEWNDVQLKARMRQHSTDECPICQEPFKQDPQVLLSCSHVFHRSCLSSFERYAQSRCCPLCRAVQYQKKVIQDGAEAYKQRCATRIQAAVRGWLARRRVKELRRHRPPSDPRLRRAWAAERLQETTTEELKTMEDARGDIDALFAELDASLAHSRALCSQLEAPAARRLQERLQVEEALALSRQLADRASAATDTEHTDITDTATSHSLTQASGGVPSLEATDRTANGAGGERPGTTGLAQTSVDRNGSHVGLVSVQGSASDRDGVSVAAAVDWDDVLKRAKARGVTECPICIGRLHRRGAAGIAWLSCTHAFHLECICAFEGFELAAGGTPTCPVCRAKYQRRCFQ